MKSLKFRSVIISASLESGTEIYMRSNISKTMRKSDHIRQLVSVGHANLLCLLLQLIAECEPHRQNMALGAWWLCFERIGKSLPKPRDPEFVLKPACLTNLQQCLGPMFIVLISGGVRTH